MAELTANRRPRLFSWIEVLVIVILALFPLFMSFPYRVNIFLSWEGAYRMSHGQIPYKDFGMPVGYMYWVIPAFFFKIFGSSLITLVKAQVLINIISGFAFRSILKSLDVQPGIRLLSVILYCISFSFFNFWPWYNHTVIVYEMVGLAFLLKYFFRTNKWIYLSLSALFIFFSFFTKQDGGGLALVLCLTLLAHVCFYGKNWKPLFIFLLSFFVVAFAIIAPLSQYNFGYWFNHGQPPHTARISLYDIMDEFFYSSQWIKFYLFIILLLVFAKYKSWKEFTGDKKGSVFLLLTLGILAEAAILQVTSYTPPDNNIFFHSFAFAFIISALSGFLTLDFLKSKTILIGLFGLFLWWSGVFWKYIQRVLPFAPVANASTSKTGENIVNRKTYMIPQGPHEIPMSEWSDPGGIFRKVSMPIPTIEGIQRIRQKFGPHSISGIEVNDWKVLNMTELTPLAEEFHYQTETGPDIPLWYHLGVGMFNQQAKQYEQKIASKYYDVVLFEYIPSLNNFFPFRIRDSLLQHYHKTDSFPAPRRGETLGLVEVYEK